MQITSFTPADIHPFLAMARDEGWISTRRELAFLLERSPDGCLVCHEGERPVGFVTAVPYGNSGWIGNLLVSAAARGKGIGSALFMRAKEILQNKGIATIWLTASAAGRPIYERSGFQVCDQVRRWEKEGSQHEHNNALVPVTADWQEIDYLGWGDARNDLLAYAAANGTTIGAEEGFLVMQQLGNGSQIGPFGALSYTVAASLLEKVISGFGRVVLDVPALNRNAGRLLTSNGFTVSSEVDLMYAGQAPAYHPEHIYGLASMGSMG